MIEIVKKNNPNEIRLNKRLPQIKTEPVEVFSNPTVVKEKKKHTSAAEKIQEYYKGSIYMKVVDTLKEFHYAPMIAGTMGGKSVRRLKELEEAGVVKVSGKKVTDINLRNLEKLFVMSKDLDVLELRLRDPYMTIRDIAHKAGIPEPYARRMVNKLLEVGFLVEPSEESTKGAGIEKRAPYKLKNDEIKKQILELIDAGLTQESIIEDLTSRYIAPDDRLGRKRFNSSLMITIYRLEDEELIIRHRKVEGKKRKTYIERKMNGGK